MRARAHVARAARLMLVAVPLLAGCAAMGLSPPEIDSQATFAAYRTNEGLTIARIEGGKTGTIDAAGWSGLVPTYHVVVAGQSVGELHVPSTAQVEVRATAPPDRPLHGEIQPSWDDGAIRLTMRPGTGDILRTRTFHRVGTTAGLSLLTRNMITQLDMRGTYRSDLRGPGDAVVGWLQVHFWEPSGQRVYEAVFPPGFPAADAAAAAIALESEVDWIRRYAIDTSRGNAGGITR
jgi:hypothetical protein